MKLDYRILWFEDNEESRDHFEDDLKSHLSAKGYELEIKWLKRYPLTTAPDFESFDLIVTDLNLLGSGDGTALVTEIRRKRILTEVLLYSGLAEKFNEAVDALGGLDRVSYHKGRNEGLQKKLRDIVDSTVRKLEGVRNMRGLVIAEAIELEGKLRRILVEVMTAKVAHAAKSHLEASIKEHLEQKIVFFQKKAAAVAKVSVSMEIMRDDQLLTAHDCHVLACRALKALGSGGGKAHRERLLSFNKDVIDLRNTLAHVAEELDELGRVVFKSRRSGGSQLVLDAGTCTQIRKTLLGYRALFAELAPFFGVKLN